MPRRFLIRTYGCQMNVHDSEKVANLLLHGGWLPAREEADADLLVINTCSIREKAEHRLYSDMGALRGWKEGGAGRTLGVRGCVAQQEGDGLLRRFPHLDFVFGTHNLRWVAEMAEAARLGRRQARTEASRSLDRFDLPGPHPANGGIGPGRAFVTAMEGCDMFCSFCIVPRTRGREISRPAAAILAEARQLAGRGVREITLLGQTVNAYGRHDLRRGRQAAAGTVGFGALLGQLAAIPGIRRIRYTSPHPLFFDEAVIRAHAELPALCPHVHLPLQSGSDRVLERMRRRYSADDYRRVVGALRAARPDLAITTDLIVAFPGETEEDFRATLALVEEVGFVDAYAFKYSPRPGTVAADLDGAVAPEMAQERLERLQGLLRRLTLEAHRARVGSGTEVLVEGVSQRGLREGRAGEAGPVQLQGRDPYHRVVNFAGSARPGELISVTIVEATPHSLIAVPAPRSEVKDPGRLADQQGVAPAAA